MATSGRLGRSQSRGQMVVRFNASPMVNLIDKETMRFRSGAFYGALSRANERAAVATQNAMVQKIEDEVRMRHRPQRDGNRLVNAMDSENNREVFANTFSVGLRSKWLNKSPARLYYRQIEEGMGSFVGNVLFTDNGGIGPHDFGPPWVRPGKVRNLRMPQFQTRGVLSVIGPYPAFHYEEAGQRAFARFPMADAYIEELRAVGIEVTKGMFK